MHGPKLQLRLLGEFRALSGGKVPVELRLKRAQLLLAALALAPSGRCSREQLMALFWSEREEAQARQSLRQTISVARRALLAAGADILQADVDGVAINLDALDCDAVVLKRAAHSGATEEQAQTVAFRSGELLTGVAIRDPVAEAWLAEHRAELQAVQLRALGLMLESNIRTEQQTDTERVATRILEIDPYEERAHRALIALFLAQGKRSLALRQFQRCRKSLQRDLSVSPSAETEALIRTPAAVTVAFPNAGAGRVAGAERLAVSRLRAPSLIIAPFEVLGEEPRAGVLAGGLADDLVVDLSRFSSLFVVPPGPAMSFERAAAADPATLSDALEIRYVLAGSVHTSGARTRITAMLLDADDRRTIWAERYDRPLTDLIDIRDSVARRIAVAASSSADAAEYERLKLQDVREFGAWELCTLARRSFLAYRPEQNAQARSMYERALAIDGACARAEVGLGLAHFEDACFGWSRDPTRSFQNATAHAHRALSIESRHYGARYLLSYLNYFKKRFSDAQEECHRALADNPNDPELMLFEGMLMSSTGQAEKGIDRVEEALCLDPYHPEWFHFIHGMAAIEVERYEAALAGLTRYIKISQGPFVGVKLNALRMRVVANQHSGRRDAARRDATAYLAADPSFRVSNFARLVQRQDPASIERLTSGLRLAGLPA